MGIDRICARVVRSIADLGVCGTDDGDPSSHMADAQTGTYSVPPSPDVE